MKPIIKLQEKASLPFPEVDAEKCNYCGKCASVCAYDAIAVYGKQVIVSPRLCRGCGVCSYICPNKAIKEQPLVIGVVRSGQSEEVSCIDGKISVGEATIPSLIRKVKNFASKEDLTIIDSPPGTSCSVITAIRETDFCLFVTEPTPFGLNDLTLSVETVQELKIPCGVVINRNVNGEPIIERYCQEEDIPVLLTIPLDTEIARLYSRGITLVQGMPRWKQSFVELYQKIQEIVQ